VSMHAEFARMNWCENITISHTLFVSMPCCCTVTLFDGDSAAVEYAGLFAAFKRLYALVEMAASLQKAFNKLHSDIARATESIEGTAKTVAPKSEEDILRERTTPMTLADCIPRILLAWSDKDYFRYFPVLVCAACCPVVHLICSVV
jgi:hypothetical protein